jgi:hypothetical protein
LVVLYLEMYRPNALGSSILISVSSSSSRPVSPNAKCRWGSGDDAGGVDALAAQSTSSLSLPRMIPRTTPDKL